MEIRPLHKPLAELPLTILQFTGEDRPLRDEIEAQCECHRLGEPHVQGPDWSQYFSPRGGIHGPRPADAAAPSHRLLPGSWWTESLASSQCTVGTTDPITASMLTVDREGSRSYVLYWYFWDDKVCTTRSQATMARLRMVGRQEWPPVVKVLLETPIGGPSTDAAKTLTDFAAVVHDWTKSL